MNFSLLRALSFAFLSLIAVAARAQCLYTLEMLDSFGDGWNGGNVTLTVNGTPVTYTLDAINDDGIDSTLTFNVIDGAPLLVSYISGGFASEVSFRIYDNTGSLFLSTNAPATGTIFNGVGECISCGEVSALELENVWDNRARLRWKPNNGGTSAPISWRVIYGPQGFSLNDGAGDTLDVALPRANLLGLQKKTWYDAYVQQYCDATGGYSDFVGPISFQTYWTHDLGITAVVSPQSDCGLGSDSVKVILKNFGAAPQSLFSFRYSVNGTPAMVFPPSDGFYTGILGKDSSVVVAFETLSDFSNSGEYRLDVFTELATDEDVQNDTFTYFFTNSLKPTYFEQFETWSGGWTPGGQNSSWEFGTPNKPAIPEAASGLNAWVTSLTGSYNFSENSYLESPCFDFSDLDEDPAFQFALNHSMQVDFDGAWLEMTLDGGQNWEKIGEEGEGLNWYNSELSFFGLSDAWSGNSGGWVTARHSLPNSAGESEVRLRFVMMSAPFFVGGGLGIDDVQILETSAKDLSALNVTTLGESVECGLENDQIVFTFVNVGNQTQSSVPVAYSINGAAPVLQNVSGSIATDQSLTHTFSVPFDSRDQNVVIKCWTALSGDQTAANDTIVYTINHAAKPVPFQENFESYDAPPTDWTYEPPFGFSVTNGHNNISKVLAFNLYSFNPTFSADMPRLGLIQSGDSLRFTYRITNFASQGQTPTVLQGGSKIDIQVSTDCGETYQTVNTISSFNHSPSIVMKERKISLNDFAGQFIKIRFNGVWGASDFWVDIDNINILSCASDMDLSANVSPATPGLNDGSATVNVGLGNPPYAYAWSNGANTQTVDSLGSGTYSVTVVDAFGCSDEFSFNLFTSGTNDLANAIQLALFPNPSSGLSTLQATFGQKTDVQVEILNATGQRLWVTSANAVENLSQPLDLTQFPSGLYLVRVSAEGKTALRKLIRQ